MTERPWMTALEAQFAAMRETQIQLAHDPEPGYRQLLNNSISALRCADTYDWSVESATAVRQAARTVPLDTTLEAGDFLAEGYVLAPRWYWFEGDPQYELPLPLPGNPPSIHRICALLLQPAQIKPDDEVPTRAAPAGYGIGFTLYGYSTTDSAKRLFPSGNFAWGFGEPLSAVLTRGKTTLSEVSPIAAAIGEDLSRFVAASQAWLNQRYLVETAGPVERHRRKQLAREYALEAPWMSDVKVIHLRRRESTPRQATDGAAGVDWQCRWIVNGHWTHQVCGPGRTGRRLKWIQAYPKGPADKPLRVPKTTVYVVDR